MEFKTIDGFEADDYDVIELEVTKNNNPENAVDKIFISEDKLKEEAIKHYKAVKNGDLVIDVPTYIRWYNGLTEEDLEEKQDE